MGGHPLSSSPTLQSFIRARDEFLAQVAAGQFNGKDAAQVLFSAGLIAAPTAGAMVAYLRGAPGSTPILTTGTVSQLSFGSTPTFSILPTATPGTYALSLGVPVGGPGVAGPAPTITASASALPAGSAATATVTGSNGNYNVAIGVPIGGQGNVGPAPTITASTITLSAGSPATVNVTGGNGTYNLALGVPQGVPGNTGPAPNLTIGTITKLPPGSTPTASLSGSNPNYSLNLGLVTGDGGAAGAGTGDMLRANNLSDVNDKDLALNNLGAGTGSGGGRAVFKAADEAAVRAAANLAKNGANTDITSITGSAAKLTNARSIAITGDITYTVSFDGSANVTGTATLPNSGVSAGTYGSVTAIPVVTVGAKGLVTSVTTATIGTAAQLTADNDGALTSNSSTAVATQQAVRSYVDGKINGVAWKLPVRAATTTAVALSSFVPGVVVDTVTLAAGDDFLNKNASNAAENGIYTIQASGGPVRRADADTGAELVNATVYVAEGAAVTAGGNADTQWTCTANRTPTLGTTPLAFVRSGAGGVLLSSLNLSDVADPNAARSNIYAQFYSDRLQAIAALSSGSFADGTMVYYTSATAAGTLASTSYGRGLLALADAAAFTARGNTFTASLKGLVSAPGTATGKLLRDDGAWVSVSGGVNQGYGASRLYGPPRALGFTQQYNLPGGGTIFFPVIVTAALTISTLAVRGGDSAGYPGNRIGLYNSTNGQPNTLLTQTAEFTSQQSTINKISCPTVTIQPGLYYLAIGNSGGGGWNLKCTVDDGSGFNLMGVRPNGFEAGYPFMGGSVTASGLPSTYSDASNMQYYANIYAVWFIPDANA